MSCGRCGAPVEGTALYCRGCGATSGEFLVQVHVAPIGQRERFCGSCGGPVEAADLYCRRCGRGLALEPGVAASSRGSASALEGAGAGFSSVMARAGRAVSGSVPGAEEAWRKVAAVFTEPAARAEFLASFREPLQASGIAVIAGLVLSSLIYACVSGTIQDIVGEGTPGLGAVANPLTIFAASHLLTLTGSLAVDMFGLGGVAGGLYLRAGVLLLLVVPFVGLLAGTAIMGPRFRERRGKTGQAFAVRVACLYALALLLVTPIVNQIVSGMLKGQAEEFAYGAASVDVGLSLGSALVMGVLTGYFLALLAWYLTKRGAWSRSAFAGGARTSLACFLGLSVVGTLVALLKGASAVRAVSASLNIGAYALLYLSGLPVKVGAGTAFLLGGWRGVDPTIVPGAWHYVLLIVPLGAILLGGRALERRRREDNRPVADLGDSLARSVMFGLGYGAFGALLAYGSRVSFAVHGAVDILADLLPGGVMDAFNAGGSPPGAFVLLTMVAAAIAFAGTRLVDAKAHVHLRDRGEVARSGPWQ